MIAFKLVLEADGNENNVKIEDAAEIEGDRDNKDPVFDEIDEDLDDVFVLTNVEVDEDEELSLLCVWFDCWLDIVDILFIVRVFGTAQLALKVIMLLLLLVAVIVGLIVVVMDGDTIPPAPIIWGEQNSKIWAKNKLHLVVV